MLKEAIKEAATLDEAKAAAVGELGRPVDEVQFEILQMPQKKTLGLFGGSPARVRAFVEILPSAVAAEYLLAVLKGMGVTEVSVRTQETDNGCTLSLEGEDLGFIIGRRGDTLDALQYLTGLVANRVDNAYYRVTIDIGTYRETREQALTGLAKKIAGQAARTGRKTSLEPMNPYERRIIHTAVQEIAGATSWSVGSEPNRHVVVGPSDDNPAKAKASRGGRHGRGGSKEGRTDEGRGERKERPRRSEPHTDVAADRPVRQFVPRSHPLPVAEDAQVPSRTSSEKEQSATLYGRIDL